MKRKLAIGAAGTALTGLVGLIATVPGGMMLFVRPIKTVRMMRQRGSNATLFDHLDRHTFDPDRLAVMANQGWCSQERQELFAELCSDQPWMKPDMKRRLALALGIAKPSNDEYIPTPQPA